MTVADTSIAAYAAEKPRRLIQEDRVRAHIARSGSSTIAEIAQALHLPDSTVSGRIGDLRDRGLIVECGRRRDHSGHMKKLWKLAPADPQQLSLFRRPS